MASLKRYKQPSENNNRQDIPPRFKRQKSLTSQMAVESPKDANHQNKKGSWVESSVTSTPQQKVSSSFPKEGRKIVKKPSPQRAQFNVEKRVAKSSSEPFVLLPVENKMSNLKRNDKDGKKQTYSNAKHMLNVNTLTNSTSQQTHSPQNSYMNSAINYVQGCTDPYDGVKKYSSNNNNSQPQTHFPSMQQVECSGLPPSCKEQEKEKNYSDPDIRTIEMLRELERVADQTDVGSDENCNDKNSLVSHHLRMLMCAVDRYTQGVDEDSLSDNTDDETLLQDEIQPPSSQCSPQTLKKHPYLSQDSASNRSTPSSQVSIQESLGNYYSANSMCSPQIPVNNYQYLSHDNSSNRSTPNSHMSHESLGGYHSTNSNHVFEMHMPPPNMSPLVNKKLNTWNPWSTPSFNALDVYTSLPSVQDSHPSLFHFDHHSYPRDSCL